MFILILLCKEISFYSLKWYCIILLMIEANSSSEDKHGIRRGLQVLVKANALIKRTRSALGIDPKGEEISHYL